MSFEKILQTPLSKNEVSEIVLVTYEASAHEFQDIVDVLRDLPLLKI